MLASSAFATNTFDPATKLLTLDALTISGTTYNHVAVTLDSYRLLSTGTGNPADAYDPASQVLVLGSVIFQGATLNNVHASIAAYTLHSIGATTDTAPPPHPLITPAYYVSPEGSDANAGSAAKPFQTLEKAQFAMRTSSIKTTYLMGGVYKRSASLDLGISDAGETWIAYPGQTPVLDGGDTTAMAIAINANNISVRWLTIQNFSKNGISTWNASGFLIDNNTIKDIKSTGWGQAGIVMQNNLSSGQVRHNLIQNTQYAGILYANSAGDTLGKLVIDSNAIYNVCTSIPDCGAIHADDRSHATTGISITNNVIGGYGSTSNQNKAIYLDDQLSHTTVENNIVYGTGMYAIQYHGGDNNMIRNNIFDISSAQALGLYQYSSLANYGMANNAFTCNIVYSSSPRSNALWVNQIVAADATLNDISNIYWSPAGAIANTGSIVDTAPTVADPGFVDPSHANYNFTSHTVPGPCTFQPIDASHVGPLPHP